MFQREYIEKLLSLNGVSIDSSDDEIKSVLLSARWHKDDVEAAVLVLRENTKTHETHVDSLHKIYRSDERMRPETVSALLGVEMNISGEDITKKRRRVSRGLGPAQMLSITLISLALSLIFVFSAMWYLQTGLFHTTLR